MESEGKFRVVAMVSFQSMLSLILSCWKLCPLNGQRVLRVIHKEPTMSTEHKTDVKDVLDKFDSQGESSSMESLEQLFNNSP